LVSEAFNARPNIVVIGIGTAAEATREIATRPEYALIGESTSINLAEIVNQFVESLPSSALPPDDLSNESSGVVDIV